MPTHNFTLTVNTGTSQWTNSANALAQDAVYATTTLGLQDLYYDYSTSVIPAGSTINNITVTARGYMTGFTTNIFYLREIGQRSFSDGSPLSATFTGTPTTYTLVNDTGANLGVTAANINALSNLRFRNTVSGSGTMFVDSVTFSVTYTDPPSGNALFFGENF